MTEFTNEELAQAFALQVDKKMIAQRHRTYLGMSQLGHSCSRNLWYYFRWAITPEFTPRQLRIFSRGNLEEPRLIKMLKDEGVEVLDTQAEMIDCEGHLRGHSDAALYDFPGLEDQEILGEFKTMNDKSWKKMKANGVRHANKSYWAQLQIYMWYGGWKKALFIAVNKNTDELYFEIVDLDTIAAEKFQNRALDIINSKMPPPKAFDSPTYFECNWCDFKSVCWEDKPFEKNCRTCKYSSPIEDGAWGCDLMGILPVKKQEVGCDSYDCIKA